MCIFGLIKRKKKGFLSSVSFVCCFFLVYWQFDYQAEEVEKEEKENSSINS